MGFTGNLKRVEWLAKDLHNKERIDFDAKQALRVNIFKPLSNGLQTKIRVKLKINQCSPISPTLFPHYMEKEGAKQMQNAQLAQRCPLLSITMGEGSIRLS